MKKLIFLLFVTTLVAACNQEDVFGPREIDYAVKSISLSRSSITGMITGEKRMLNLSFLPAEATNKEVVWKSDDESIAKVDENGLLTAVAIGETTITVTSAENPDATFVCTVEVDKNSGIVVSDVLLDEVVDEEVIFLIGDQPRDYTYSVMVYNSYDIGVNVTSSAPDVVNIETKTIDGVTGFSAIPGTKLGEGYISVTSVANPDIVNKIPFRVITVNAMGVQLSLNEDGSAPSEAVSNEVTINRSQKVRVVFLTDNDRVPTPENNKVYCESSDVGVATVDAEGTVDPATRAVSFNVTMQDDDVNVGKSATITVTTDQGAYTATYTVTGKKPTVQSIVLDQNLSEPILAGERLILKASTIPEDAYDQNFIWTSQDESIALVEDGVVDIYEGFAFDPNNAAATEVYITVASAENPTLTAQCKLRPYQYVQAAGVMVTDQWGNRMRGTSSTTSKVSGNPKGSEHCIQYCAGAGKNKTAPLDDPLPWADANPVVVGVDRVGNISVYLTATPYPYTYPTIADPDQEFYWAAYSNSRFSLPNSTDGFKNPTGGYNYSKDDGKYECYLGKTAHFMTGHSSSGDDVGFIRVWLNEGHNDASREKTLLFRFVVHTSYAANDNYGNYVLNNPEGGAYVFKARAGAIPDPFADVCPFPWTGPAPTPVLGPVWPGAIISGNSL